MQTGTSIGKIKFAVPIHEMGEKEFNEEEPAQLLIRWLGELPTRAKAMDGFYVPSYK